MPGILIKGVEYAGEQVDIRMQDPVEIYPAGTVSEPTVIDAHGLIAVPAFIDSHVHFRDPGLTEKEDLLTGARAAAAGGYRSVECMPNTRPVMDNLPAIQAFESYKDSLAIPIHIGTAATLTIGEQGETLTALETLAMAGRGIRFFTDDGEPTVNRSLLIEALKRLDFIDNQIQTWLTIALHCEETPRSAARVREALGDGPAMRREVDLVRFAIGALEEAGVGRLRIQHVSLSETATVIADAKKRGLDVVAEVTPHHLLLCEDDISQRNSEPDPNWKMNPPLRSREDMLAMRRALAAGIIDEIATDHAPHTPAEKAQYWEQAPFGVIGLETAFSACLSLVHQGELTFSRLIEAMYPYPVRNPRALSSGLTLVDPDHMWTVDPDKFYSKSRNCPFAGMTFRGKPVYTIAGGKLVMAEGEVLF